MSPPAEGRCTTCGTPLTPGLAICARCGTALPEHRDEPRVLVLRSGPSEMAALRRAEHLLAGTGDELDGEEIRRQLASLPAMLRLPASDAAIARLVDDLSEQGFSVEVHHELPEPMGIGEYVESLWAKKTRLFPYAALLGPSVTAAALGAPFTATVLAGATWLWWRVDRQRFLRRITLEPERLARRLNLVPEEILRPIGALLRGKLSELLRHAVSGLVQQHASLLEELRGLAADYPALVGPMRETLTALTGNAVRLAEKAAAIERGGDVADPEVAARLERVRAMRSEEIEQRLLAMDMAQEARQHRAEWLRQVHALLLVRLEATSDALRSLRQRALEARVVGAGSASADRLDGLLDEARRELQVVVGSVGEIERVSDRLAERALPAERG